MQSCINNVVLPEYANLYVISQQKRERGRQTSIPKCVSLCFTCSNGSEPLNIMSLNPPWQIIWSHLINNLLIKTGSVHPGARLLEEGRWRLPDSVQGRDTGLSCCPVIHWRSLRGPAFCGRWSRNAAWWPGPEWAIFEKSWAVNVALAWKTTKLERICRPAQKNNGLTTDEKWTVCLQENIQFDLKPSLKVNYFTFPTAIQGSNLTNLRQIMTLICVIHLI